MIASKRRETEVFSLAFLDCICCGFGAVILVFILTITQKTTVDTENVAEVQARVDRLNQDLASGGRRVTNVMVDNGKVTVDVQ